MTNDTAGKGTEGATGDCAIFSIIQARGHVVFVVLSTAEDTAADSADTSANGRAFEATAFLVADDCTGNRADSRAGENAALGLEQAGIAGGNIVLSVASESAGHGSDTGTDRGTFKFAAFLVANDGASAGADGCTKYGTAFGSDGGVGAAGESEHQAGKGQS